MATRLDAQAYFDAQRHSRYEHSYSLRNANSDCSICWHVFHKDTPRSRTTSADNLDDDSLGDGQRPVVRSRWIENDSAPPRQYVRRHIRPESRPDAEEPILVIRHPVTSVDGSVEPRQDAGDDSDAADDGYDGRDRQADDNAGATVLETIRATDRDRIRRMARAFGRETELLVNIRQMARYSDTGDEITWHTRPVRLSPDTDTFIVVYPEFSPNPIPDVFPSYDNASEIPENELEALTSRVAVVRHRIFDDHSGSNTPSSATQSDPWARSRSPSWHSVELPPSPPRSPRPRSRASRSSADGESSEASTGSEMSFSLPSPATRAAQLARARRLPSSPLRQEMRAYGSPPPYRPSPGTVARSQTAVAAAAAAAASATASAMIASATTSDDGTEPRDTSDSADDPAASRTGILAILAGVSPEYRADLEQLAAYLNDPESPDSLQFLLDISRTYDYVDEHGEVPPTLPEPFARRLQNGDMAEYARIVARLLVIRPPRLRPSPEDGRPNRRDPHFRQAVDQWMQMDLIMSEQRRAYMIEHSEEATALFMRGRRRRTGRLSDTESRSQASMSEHGNDGAGRDVANDSNGDAQDDHGSAGETASITSEGIYDLFEVDGNGDGGGGSDTVPFLLFDRDNVLLFSEQLLSQIEGPPPEADLHLGPFMPRTSPVDQSGWLESLELPERSSGAQSPAIVDIESIPDDWDGSMSPRDSADMVPSDAAQLREMNLGRLTFSPTPPPSQSELQTQSTPPPPPPPSDRPVTFLHWPTPPGSPSASTSDSTGTAGRRLRQIRLGSSGESSSDGRTPHQRQRQPLSPPRTGRDDSPPLITLQSPPPYHDLNPSISPFMSPISRVRYRRGPARELDVQSSERLIRSPAAASVGAPDPDVEIVRVRVEEVFGETENGEE
ncbi:hypothetical protein KEM52_006711 [Ascosphaera acerosa]|nr:hypothetical protein KEM52_006711 [Ascosphaera acerosa]